MKNHHFIQCPKVTFQADKEKVILKHNFSTAHKSRFDFERSDLRNDNGLYIMSEVQEYFLDFYNDIEDSGELQEYCIEYLTIPEQEDEAAISISVLGENAKDSPRTENQSFGQVVLSAMNKRKTTSTLNAEEQEPEQKSLFL